ncbi:hypothetical protein D9M68_585520 [compost metagenome]
MAANAYEHMLAKRIDNPLVVTRASSNKGQAAKSTPAVPKKSAINNHGVSLLFSKKTEKKLIRTGLIATASAPTPAVTSCMAIIYSPR